MPEGLLRYRSEFPILDRTTYLISNSLGAMPRGVEDSLHQYTELWNTRGVRAWEDEWWMLALQVGDAIGSLFNAPAGSVACLQNVTSCQATVASCLDFSGRRNKVVYSDLNFPSVMYFWEAQRSRGARVNMVPNDDTIHVSTDRLLDAIDEETLIVPISHVIFRSAFIQDVEAIVEKAHRVGAYVLLDSFQATGTLPFDVQKLNVDFCTGGVLKWLCGGPGWIGHENPFGFEIGPIRYTPTIYRFTQGTPNIPALKVAQPGLRIIGEVGVENIRKKSKCQTALLMDLAAQHGWRVNTPQSPEQRAGTVSIDLPNAQQVCGELLKRDILVDYRPKAGVRFSPHFYNTDEEITSAIKTVEEILSEMKVRA